MSNAATKPVIVIVPGAWHVPAHYAYLALKLNSFGYTVDCLELSSTNDEKDLPENTWIEDINIIRNAITSHTEAGRDVAVVMHSFGGMTGSEAACGLGKKESETSGAVVKLIYMTAFMIQEGQTRASLGVGDDWPEIAELDDPKNPKALIPLDPKHFFYHDVPEQKTQRALDNLGGCPLSHVMNTPTKVAWREIPTAYLICEDDRALTFNGQKQLIDAVKAQGVEVEVASLKASHSPFLSMPGETAKAIHGFLEKA
ncbi:alpha/beta-hydrolase [Aureobasidium pullulans]|uniref:Alpha/beta-hydrolase n=1 Tax=Aureobasidium pullulans TaxID=5580 RepID=A0A4S8W9E8_AURPU|nr:alpha/beta-hydrolase [Aureobasidium pullulans]